MASQGIKDKWFLGLAISDSHIFDLTTDVCICCGNPRYSQYKRIPIEFGFGLEDQQVSGILPRINREHYVFQHPLWL
jgi:hypothetical protein